MVEPRRMICSNCEHQAPWTEFQSAKGARRCPRCGAASIRFADYEPARFGGLTAAQWELIRRLAERELRSGLVLVADSQELHSILRVAEEEALPAVGAIEEVGVLGFLDETAYEAAEERLAERNGPAADDDWAEEVRDELLEAIEEVPRAHRETLYELVESLTEALAEREAALVARVALAAGLGGELERETGGELDGPTETEGSEG